MKKITSLVLIILSTISFVKAQNVITVDNSTGSNAQYNDLQSAISAAQSGDIIYVHPSEINYGNITIDKAVSLIGFAHGSSDKISAVTDIILANGSSNSSFSGLFVSDDIYSNISNPINNITIENCHIDSGIYFNYSAGVDNIIIRGNYVFEIGVSNSNVGSNSYSNAIITNNVIGNFVGLKNHGSITIKNNVFIKVTSSSVVVNTDSDTGSITAQNNIIYNNSSFTVDLNRAGVVFENCLTYNLGSGSFAALSGTSNLNNQNPLFEEDNDNSVFEPTIDDYNLQTNSPAINAGVNGEDLGLFDGGSFTFNNFGYTNGIPTVKIEAISTTVAPGDNLNVIISTSNH